MDNRILVFLQLIAAVVLAVIVGAAIGSEEFLFPALLVGCLIAVVLIASPSLGAFLAVALYASKLTLPGLPGNLSLPQLALLSVPTLAVMLTVFGRAQLPRISKEHILLAAFCVIVLLTGYIRGFGLRFLGSSYWGGAAYVDIVIGTLLVFFLPKLNMPPRWWPVAIASLAALAVIPLAAELLIATTGAYIVALFVQVADLSISSIESGGGPETGVNRIWTAGSAATYMVLGFLALVHTRKLFSSRSPLLIGFLVGVILLSLLSGFRLMTAILILTVFLTALYQKTLTPVRVLVGIVLSLVFLVGLYSISANLPMNMQRAISWLPGIDVSSMAQTDADQTVDWRLDVWREATSSIPEYFWIGKGFAYDGNAFLTAILAGEGVDSISWALIKGAYHNGYLSLLLGFGVFGFVLGLSLMTCVLWRLVKFNFAPWKSENLLRCYQALLSSITGTTIMYLTVYGDVSAVFPGYFFTWACLEAIRTADEESKGIATPADRNSTDDHAEDKEHAFIE